MSNYDNLFPLHPLLPLPLGVSEKKMFDFVTSVRVADAPEKEMFAYGSHDFRRFVYTLGLVNGLQGKCLELGANPYFTTMLLQYYTKLDLHLANYFGSFPSGVHTQSVSFICPDDDTRKSKEFSYQHFNVETETFPYAENEFDVIVFAEIIEHLLNDPMFVLTEINRVLQKDGLLILTTPNVSRLENVARMMAGANIYDPYSGYGPYGRHNREYNKHELNLLLGYAGFKIERMFTADVHQNDSVGFFDLTGFVDKLKFREQDLGQYIFVKARKVTVPGNKKPSFLYRSYPESDLAQTNG